MNNRNTWDEAYFREVLIRAGKIIECEWGVMGIRDRRTSKMQILLLFNDKDKSEFAYAFAFTHHEEVAMLCTYLMRMADQIIGNEK